MAISTIFILLFFLSVPILIVGLIRPSLFKFLPKKIQTRGKLSLTILLTGFLCFVLALVTAPTQNVSESQVANNNEIVTNTAPKNEEVNQPPEVVVEPIQEVPEPQEEVVEVITPTNDQESEPPATITEPQPEDLILNQLWIAVDSVIRTREGIDVQYFPEDGLVVLFHDLGDNVWDENDAVRQAYADLVYYGEEAFKIDGVNELKVSIHTPFTDQYGNDNSEQAVRIGMKEEEFVKFNWDNLVAMPVWSQIKNSASDYYIHPGLLKGIDLDNLYLQSSP
ncbi:MAG: hypothetical protein A2X20_00305 [Bacteroidetes bacterium GWE2_40_15]|nr:MAG: hypothetical protein A2X20_00305 [Bacteroidetes bacterium GWE2_40_15]